MGVIIQVEGISKRYSIDATQSASEGTSKEALSALGSRIGSFFFGSSRGRTVRDDFWALRDISFSVNQGDRIGIIGKNGAGKSTLFKILTRITEPTTGSAILRGRIGSLLEVGAGFHPELTGRENIVLTCTLMGMSRREICKCIDRVTDFSGVGSFLDTPVKRYSSGMFVRLGFSIAAHMSPDIFLVDEALAVADAEFTQQCIEMLKQIARDGRTLLLVSHDMASIKLLCNKVLVLRDGRLVTFSNDVDTVISQYLLEQTSTT